MSGAKFTKSQDADGNTVFTTWRVWRERGHRSFVTEGEARAYYETTADAMRLDRLTQTIMDIRKDNGS